MDEKVKKLYRLMVIGALCTEAEGLPKYFDFTLPRRSCRQILKFDTYIPTLGATLGSVPAVELLVPVTRA